MTTNRERQAKHRAKGRPVSLTLTDPEAIEAFTRLIATYGTQREAVETALTALDRNLRRRIDRQARLLAIIPGRR